MKTRMPAPARRAFTLVEVLVGILILGLGLLGLGAIYPAVAIQQRGASDAVEGQAAADAAEAFFKGNGWLNRRSAQPATLTDPRIVQGWDAALLANGGGKGRGWRSIEDDGSSNFDPRLISLDGSTGDITIGAPGAQAGYDFPDNATDNLLVISARDRLMPRVSNASVTPFGDARFVWDAAARRVDRTSPLRLPATNRTIREKLQDVVQVAVFVRRLDPGIRNREGVQYVPVAQTEDGLASLDGVGTGGPADGANYAPIRLMELVPSADAFPQGTGIPANAMIRYVHLSDSAPVSVGMTADSVDTAIGQVGQKFALADGTVVTVLSVQRDARLQRNVLRIDPEVPNWAFNIRPNEPEGIPALFTAQPPVAVRVFTLRDGGAI